METAPPPEPSEAARPCPQLDSGLLVSRLREGLFLSRCAPPGTAAQNVSAAHVSEQRSPRVLWALHWGLERGRDRKRETIWQTKEGGCEEEERAHWAGHARSFCEATGWRALETQTQKACPRGPSVPRPHSPAPNSTTVNWNTPGHVQSGRAGVPAFTIFILETTLICAM